jgi:hypothetical protein
MVILGLFYASSAQGQDWYKYPSARERMEQHNQQVQKNVQKWQEIYLKNERERQREDAINRLNNSIDRERYESISDPDRFREHQRRIRDLERIKNDLR